MECDRCTGTMRRTTVPRVSGAGIAVGQIVTLLSAGVLLWSLVVMADEATRATGVIVASQGLVSLALGLALASRRPVWACGACGALAERDPAVR